MEVPYTPTWGSGDPAPSSHRLVHASGCPCHHLSSAQLAFQMRQRLFLQPAQEPMAGTELQAIVSRCLKTTSAAFSWAPQQLTAPPSTRRPWGGWARRVGAAPGGWERWGHSWGLGPFWGPHSSFLLPLVPGPLPPHRASCGPSSRLCLARQEALPIFSEAGPGTGLASPLPRSIGQSQSQAQLRFKGLGSNPHLPAAGRHGREFAVLSNAPQTHLASWM